VKHFLQRISLAEAIERVTAGVERLEGESIATEQSLARITSERVCARHATPHYRAAAMDGIAVRAAHTHDKETGDPVRLRALARPRRPGDPPPESGQDRPGVCLPVDTGDPVPDWADAVVRIENTRTTESGYEVLDAVFPGKDIRRVGEDIEKGARILPRGHRIGPYDIGALLATGVAHVGVVRRPRIAAITTGGEIVEPGGPPRSGRVIEFNARVLSASAESWGARAIYLGGVGDDREQLAARILEAVADHDMVCVMAGSSVGRKDFSVDVLGECGTILLHGVDVMPGHPVAAATVEGTTVFAVPGYPVSAVVVYREMIAPVLARMLGITPAEPETLGCRVVRDIPSRLGMEEFLRVCVRWDDEVPVAAPLRRGAGSIGSMVEADGLLRIARTCEGIPAGRIVEVELLGTSGSMPSRIVLAGSPDPFTADLEDRLRQDDPSVRFRYLGRSGEEIWQALYAGEAHLARFERGDRAQAERVGRRPQHTDGPSLRVEPADDSGAFLIVSSLLDRHPVGNRLLERMRPEG